MSSIYGDSLRISLFGQSHSPAVGVTVDGLPAGFSIDMDKLLSFLARRAPGRNALSTPRKESDLPEFLGGIVDSTTCGAPLTAIIRNQNTRSGDYDALRDIPRPAHADYAAHIKYGGFQDVAGGGHFSARLTAPLCVAGGICLQILEKQGIRIAAHIASIGGIDDRRFDPVDPDMDAVSSGFPVLDAEAGNTMQNLILACKAEGDSVGGTVECAVTGLPAGLGDPIFGGMENRLASILFGIPAVKGLEFGSGFEGSRLRGSRNNDGYTVQNGAVRTVQNNHGGILGGITSGMPLIFRAAFKPTPSIAQKQQSVSLRGGKETVLEIKGRHDPCIVPRAVPCVEAAAAIAVLDALLSSQKDQIFRED